MKNLVAKTYLKTVFLSFVSITLASCGGGSSSPTAVTLPVVVSSPTLGACFALTPGTKFVRTDGSKKLVVQETFEGQTAFSAVELRANDTRFGAFFQVVGGGFVNFLGILDYDINGVSSGTKNVYSSGYRVAVDLAPGQTVQLNYTDTQTRTQPTSSTTVNNVTEQFNFVGFENLTLGGRTFSDVCKIRSPNAGTGQATVTWFASGFGAIRSEKQDALGVMVPGSRNELVTVLAAP